jgi:hypothetical protein
MESFIILVLALKIESGEVNSEHDDRTYPVSVTLSSF